MSRIYGNVHKKLLEKDVDAVVKSIEGAYMDQFFSLLENEESMRTFRHDTRTSLTTDVTKIISDGSANKNGTIATDVQGNTQLNLVLDHVASIQNSLGVIIQKYVSYPEVQTGYHKYLELRNKVEKTSNFEDLFREVNTLVRHYHSDRAELLRKLVLFPKGENALEAVVQHDYDFLIALALTLSLLKVSLFQFHQQL